MKYDFRFKKDDFKIYRISLDQVRVAITQTIKSQTDPPKSYFLNRKSYSINRTSLNFHDFFFLGFAHLFHLLDLIVSELLDLFQRAALVIFRDFFVFQRLFDLIVTIAADVADGGAVFFQNLMQVFDHLLAALFSE